MFLDIQFLERHMDLEMPDNMEKIDLLQLIVLDIIRCLLPFFHIFQRTVKYDDHQFFLYSQLPIFMQLWVDLIMPGQQWRLLLPLWKQDKMIISKNHASLEAYVLILVDSRNKRGHFFLGKP